MRKYLPLAAMALLAPLSTQAYLFSTGFDSGNLPKTMTTTNMVALNPVAADYRYGYTEKGWIVDQVYNAGYAAICPTHTLSDQAMQSVLSLPAITIEGTAPMLRWQALSIFPDLRESYNVVVAETDGEKQVVFSTDAEDDVWRYHAVDLSAFIGKEVTISFVCNSVNKYLLALDNIAVGDPEENLTAVYDLSSPLVAYGEGTAAVSGLAGNYGKPVDATSLAAYCGSEKVAEIELTEPWTAGKEIPFELAVPVKLNQQTAYKIVAEGPGVFVTLHEGSLYATSYKRHLLIDEGTGLWCVNCPDGLLNVQALERTYRDCVLPLSSHVNDILAVQGYVDGLSFRSLPRLVLNRNRASEGESDKNFGPYIFEPTDMGIEVTDYTIQGDFLTVKAAVCSATELDNSSDRYRIGYTLTTDFISAGPDTRFVQQNMGGGVVKQQFHFLPSKIPAELNPMKNVVISYEDAFEGIEGSLKGTLSPEPTEYSWQVEMPTKLSDWDKGRIVAYIVDTETGHVVNACASLLDNPTLPDEPDPIDPDPIDPDPIDPDDPASLSKPGADAATAQYFTIDGLRVAEPTRGLYIMRQGAKVRKVIIK